MELTRRFVFRANASAYGGQIFWRKDQRLTKPIILEPGATSSLTVVGGRSHAEARPARFVDGFVRVGRGETNATGYYDDFKRAVSMLGGEGPEDSLTTTTKAGASVEDVVLGKDPKELRGEQPPESKGKPRLSIGWMGGALIMQSGKPGDEFSAKLVARETSIDDVEIDGYGLKVILSTAVFEKLDTFSKVQAAMVDPTFAQETNDCFFRESRIAGSANADSQSGTVRPTSLVLGTIVHELRWAKKPHPSATIDHHSVKIPDFGTVFFGEIFISGESRRVTMMRVRFGSPLGGMYASCDYDGNGGWHPPTP